MKKIWLLALVVLGISGCSTQYEVVEAPNRAWDFVILEEPIVNLKVRYVDKEGKSKLGFLNAPVGSKTVVGVLPNE